MLWRFFFGRYHLFGYSRHIESCCWMKCRRMILKRYPKTQKLKNPSTQTRFARSSIKWRRKIKWAFRLQECRKIILVTPAHHTSNDQTFMTRTFMQVCCSKNINVKPVSLRSTPCSHISLIMFEDALGCYHLFRYSRHIEAWCWMKCIRMILKIYANTQ